jgi:hypothetical protein
VTDDSRRTAIKRYLRRYPGDATASSLLRPDPQMLAVDVEYAWVQWRDAVDDFVAERQIRTIVRPSAKVT